MLSFQEFKAVAKHMAGYLHTTISRVFESDGNYTAHFNECDAFDRLNMTGRVSTRKVTVNYGDGHTMVFEVH